MFGNLRKKLSGAIQEGISISENLRNRSTKSANGDSVSSGSRNSLSNLELNAPDLNMAAGCNLLAKYEDDWKAIHDANEENAQKAAAVAEQIEGIEATTTTQRVVMTDLITCMSCIPALLAKLQLSMETLKQLNELNDIAEQELERLEDLCEACDLQEFMLQKECELSQHKQKKMCEMELYREKVASEHQLKIRQYEERLRRIQRERQAVFDDAFRGDLEEFKQSGTIPKIEKEPSREVALDEVILDDTETKDALEEFLNG